MTDVLAAGNAGTDSAFRWRDHREGDGPETTPDYEIDSLHGLVAVARP